MTKPKTEEEILAGQQPTGESSEGVGPIAEETQEAPEATNPPTPTNAERLRGHFTDREFGDDDELYGAAADHIGELRDWRSKREASDKEVIAIFKSHPKIAQVMQYIMQGAPEIEAISRVFDAEDLIRYEGEPDYDQWAEGKKKREADTMEAEEKKGQYELNYQASLKAVEEFCAANGLDEEGKAALLDSLFAVYDDLLDGKVSPETLLLFHKGNTHDEDVADAAAQGKVEGKNEKIEVKKQKSIKGDGLPEIDGGGAAEIKAQKPESFEIPKFKNPNELIDEHVKKQRKG